MFNSIKVEDKTAFRSLFVIFFDLPMEEKTYFFYYNFYVSVK